MKFAFVTPRYGADISLGAEHACRLLAERLCRRHDVDVLTTCARDPRTWRNEYSEGSDRVRGVLVRRFAVNQVRDDEVLQQLSSRALAAPHSQTDAEEWVNALGPSSPGLISFLKRQNRSYDAVVFFSLYHATTVHGIAAAPDRSVVFPCLRLDPPLRLSIWRDILESARAIGYLAAAERDLAHGYLGLGPAAEEVVGVGVDIPEPETYPRHQQDPADTVTSDDDEGGTLPDTAATPDYLSGRGIPFRRRHRLHDPFALYGGRVEHHNGCEEMLEYFDAAAATDGASSLVMMGVKMMKVPDAPYIRVVGVASDRERLIAYEAAEVTLAPDPVDLLARQVLESFAVGTPVLAAASNDTAVEHCRSANAGLYYANREEFVESLQLIMSNTQLRTQLGENGRRYIQQHYRWDVVMARFERLIKRVPRR
ncbi:MAG: glycosyltransferase [Acidobacteria bacterium]|nr:glycosyltransferase [Acidobacteriota bacterium]